MVLKQWAQGIRGFAKQGFYEADLHLKRVREPYGRPTVLIFPSNQPWDPASNLRAWIPAQALRALGWRVIVVPAALGLSQRRRIVQLERPNVILMQQTRHLLNDPSLFPEVPCVLDADDADFLDPRHAERIGRVAAAAVAVIGGSRFVADGLSRYNPNSSVIWTGTPQLSTSIVPNKSRGSIVAWAHSSPLEYPKEAALVQTVMSQVAAHTEVEFWLFGSTEEKAGAYLDPIRQTGCRCVAIPSLPYGQYLEKVSQAALGLQPVCLDNEFSQGKSFGKILAYLAGHCTVIASNAVDHPMFFRQGENGFLVNTTQEWVDSIVTLLMDPIKRHSMADAAYHDFGLNLTTSAFSQKLDKVLRCAAKLPG